MTTRQPLLMPLGQRYSPLPMALNTSNSGINTSTPASMALSITTSAENCLIVLGVGQCFNGTITLNASTVADDVGLVWTRRGAASGGVGTIHHQLEEFYAYAAAAGTYNITITFHSSPLATNAAVAAMVFTGINATGNGGFDGFFGPAPGSYANSTTPAAYNSSTDFSSTYSSLEVQNTLILFRLISFPTATQSASVPSVQAQNPSTSGKIALMAAYHVYTTKQTSVTLVATGSNNYWIVIADALAG